MGKVKLDKCSSNVLIQKYLHQNYNEKNDSLKILLMYVLEINMLTWIQFYKITRRK